MWLTSFERFFRIKNQPLSDRETRQLALRNWSEELRLVDNVILRVVQLCSAILTEEQVNLTRFDKYLEGYLKKDEIVDPYIEKLVRQQTPEAGLTLLREAFEDLHLRPQRPGEAVPHPLRDLHRGGEDDLPGDPAQPPARPAHRQEVQAHPRPHRQPRHRGPGPQHRSPPSASRRPRSSWSSSGCCTTSSTPTPRPPTRTALKNTILVFSLITSETRLLLSYLEKRVMRGLDPGRAVCQLYDSFVYCMPLELKKVINTELIDISVARQADSIRRRVENSHGILKDCFQQSVVQLAQVVRPRGGGPRHLPGLHGQARAVRAPARRPGRPDQGAARVPARARTSRTAVRMKEEISDFYDNSMKFLMYRDWSGFELFFIEILKCASLPALQQIAHRFETFLMTLFREVQKRSILHEHPLPRVGSTRSGAAA